MAVSGYDLQRVLRFCDEHGRVRADDGRVLRLNGRKLLETYRNSIANWRARDIDVPLGRWDELLLSVDLMLWMYEDWELEKYGDLSYTETVPVDTGVYQSH